MKNTEKYFYCVAGFIEDVSEIKGKYDKAVQRLEAFKGSEVYDQYMRDAKAQLDSEVLQMRETYLKQFRETLGKMRDSISCRPMIPPTQEQTALLSALQMRKTLTQDDLSRTAQQLKGCPAALAVLDDLAAEHSLHGGFNRELSTKYLRRRVDTLENTALKLIQAGADAANRRMPKDVVSCLMHYGIFNYIPKKGVIGSFTSSDLEPDTETINAFRAAVDG